MEKGGLDYSQWDWRFQPVICFVIPTGTAFYRRAAEGSPRGDLRENGGAEIRIASR
jgi:hypothetical protein